MQNHPQMGARPAIALYRPPLTTHHSQLTTHHSPLTTHNSPLTTSLPVIAMGILLGVLMSVLFALYPLIGTLYISPLQALRVVEERNIKSRKAMIAVSLGIVLFIFLFSLWLLGNWKYALAFVGGIAVTFAILTGLAYAFIRAIKTYFPHNWGFVSRQSLQNLFRPQNQTLTLVLSIGVGAFLISTLYFSKDLLLAQASLESQANSPNMILLDVQSNQRESLKKTISRNGLPVLSDVPIVTMRVKNIAGKSVSEIKKDSTSQINGWVLCHEFRTTYRDTLISSENIKSGSWSTEPSLVPFLILLPGLIILVLITGLSNSLSTIRKPPLEVLRKEVSGA